jgi:clan AA aspartic protease (TIGR02281 family)
VNRQADRVRCIRHPGGVLVTVARLNRRALVRLLVDTGAAITVVVPRAAIRLGLPLDKPHRTMIVGTAHTARASPIPIFELDSLQIGNVEATDLEVGVVDFPSHLRIDGALGVNFLARFRPTFEFDTAMLVLRPLPG